MAAAAVADAAAAAGLWPSSEEVLRSKIAAEGLKC